MAKPAMATALSRFESGKTYKPISGKQITDVRRTGRQIENISDAETFEFQGYGVDGNTVSIVLHGWVCIIGAGQEHKCKLFEGYRGSVYSSASNYYLKYNA